MTVIVNKCKSMTVVVIKCKSMTVVVNKCNVSLWQLLLINVMTVIVK